MSDLKPKPDEKTVEAMLGYQASIVIGGSAPEKFVPNINCSFKRELTDEYYININADDILVTNEQEVLEDNNAEIKVGDRTDKFFVDNDCLEHQIILDKKPSTNKIELKITCSPALSFYPQVASTPEEIAAGYEVNYPDDILNSYAVYCDKRHYNEYQTGKVAHIKRSWVEDKNKKRTWCEDSINVNQGSGSWIIAIPEAIWSDDSLYPLIVGPNMGYDTIGASTLQLSPGRQGVYGLLSPDSDGDAQTMFMHGNGTPNITLGILDSNGDVLRDTAGGDTASGYNWNEQALDSDLGILAANQYYLAFNQGGSFTFSRDSGGVNSYEWDSHTYNQGTLADMSVGLAFTTIPSIYAEYVISGGGVTVDCTLGEVNIAGLNPSISEGIDVNSTLGEINIAGLNPNISIGTDINVSLGEINIAGLNPGISVGIGIAATLGQINIAGLGVDISEGINVDCTLGEISISGLNANVQTGLTIDCTLGMITIDKLNANISVGTDINCTLGSVNIAGLNPDINLGVVVEATLGEVNIVGINPNLSIGTTIDSTLGEVNITGLNANISLPTNIDCTKGEISISSLNPDIVSTVLVDVTLGQIDISGLAANVQIGELESSPFNRTLIIAAENRTLAIETENRTLLIEEENRTYII